MARALVASEHHIGLEHDAFQQHPLVEQLHEYGPQHFAGDPGSGTRTLIEQFLADHDLRPETLTLGSNGAIKQAARAGLGISLLSEAAVEGELDSARLAKLPLSEAPATRPWFLLRAATGPVKPTVEVFIAFVRRPSGKAVAR